MSFAIFIPARNVDQTLKSVVERLPVEVRNEASEIIVVDNASTDKTAAIARILQKDYSQITLIQHQKNLGYGGSQKSAYAHCFNKGYDFVIMVHGDGQYAPELAGNLLTSISSGKAAMLFGSRISGDPLGGRMPLYRYIANIFLTVIANACLGTKLSEFHSGYRVYRLNALKKVPLEKLSNDYHFDTEIIIALVANKEVIEEVTIPTYYGIESKSISFWHSIWYGVNVLRAVLGYRLKNKIQT